MPDDFVTVDLTTRAPRLVEAVDGPTVRWHELQNHIFRFERPWFCDGRRAGCHQGLPEAGYRSLIDLLEFLNSDSSAAIGFQIVVRDCFHFFAFPSSPACCRDSVSYTHLRAH